jgi:hypothetical protein
MGRPGISPGSVKGLASGVVAALHGDGRATPDA